MGFVALAHLFDDVLSEHNENLDQDAVRVLFGKLVAGGFLCSWCAL